MSRTVNAQKVGRRARCAGCGKLLWSVASGARCSECKDAANKDKASAYQRRYYAANKDKVAARARRYYAANKDKVAARVRRYRAANKDVLKIAAIMKLPVAVARAKLGHEGAKA